MLDDTAATAALQKILDTATDGADALAMLKADGYELSMSSGGAESEEEMGEEMMAEEMPEKSGKAKGPNSFSDVLAEYDTESDFA